MSLKGDDVYFVLNFSNSGFIILIWNFIFYVLREPQQDNVQSLLFLNCEAEALEAFLIFG
ncbi:hypothetical protein D3C86_1398050 [compost metagenome]